MSEMERHIGKVRVANLQGMETEEWCKKKCKELGIEKDQWNATYEDALLNEPYPAKVVKVNGEFWEVIEDKEEEDYNDISLLLPNGDGTFNYLFQFNNGGTCFGEMLEDEIKRMCKNTQQ
jgi:hypothetical protein